ncbi:TolC family outer membrane protein [Aquabacterium sp. CECT 9606]|uniref:TolC family outer membrane protein n=1 Tax=Aquabacterium sp. CECT 9606 TaxID=2845822 RepID=UPI001E5CC6CB|nr:TolC family outer membrane protein [Aquabacterium sp. CECT 9606]CAH0349118.1 Outer membrane protein TolC [Aquabacterium sp. CECT 9606]
MSPNSKRPALRPVVCAAAIVLMSMSSWATAQTQQARAQSLVELFQAAKSYDAAYLSAKSEADSAQYKAAQADALRLPTVGLRGTIDRTYLDSSAPGAAGEAATGYGTKKTLGLSAKQPLFNRANDADVGKGQQALVAAQASLKSAEDDLVVRLTQAYFDVLAAQDILNTSQTNKKALSEQLAAAKRNFEVGNATITDTREAQARYDLAGAQEIAATNDLRVKGLALDQLVGQIDVKPRPLMTPVNLPVLMPSSVDEWTSQTAQSPTVRKAEVALALAKLDTAKARAGHMPTLDATATIANTDIDSNAPGAAAAQVAGSAGTTAAVGLELNVPLFAGFAVQNRIKETLVGEEKAEHDLDNAKRSITLGTRQAFLVVQSGMAQVKAYEAAEASAKLALEATQLGYRVGVRINKDVLDAQNLLANTQKDLYKARYDVLVASMRLRQASGTLKPEDLDTFNKLLAPQ